MSIGDEKRLFELRKQLSRTNPEPAELPTLPEAIARGESFYFRYDVAAVLSAALAQQGKTLPSGAPGNLEYAIGAKDGKTWLRMSIGAQDVRALRDRAGAVKP